jgi:hypothetical protein
MNVWMSIGYNNGDEYKYGADDVNMMSVMKIMSMMSMIKMISMMKMMKMMSMMKMISMMKMMSMMGMMMSLYQRSPLNILANSWHCGTSAIDEMNPVDIISTNRFHE